MILTLELVDCIKQTCPLQCGQASPNPLKAWREQKLEQGNSAGGLQAETVAFSCHWTCTRTKIIGPLKPLAYWLQILTD